MIFNFEYEHDGALYDVDAESRCVGPDKLEIVLLEVRRVNDDVGFAVVPLDEIAKDEKLAAALAAAAAAEYELLCEPDAPRVFDRD